MPQSRDLAQPSDDAELVRRIAQRDQKARVATPADAAYANELSRALG